MMIEIPVSAFDQSKLEQLLRKAPHAYVREESVADFVRRHYRLPREKSSFEIKCEADHYFDSPMPSATRCSVRASATSRGDEVLIQNADLGLQNVKLFSSERVYGQSYDGAHRQLFRYMFDCKAAGCKITFATKAPEEILPKARRSEDLGPLSK